MLKSSSRWNRVKSCSWWLVAALGCAHLAIRIPGAKTVGSSGQARPRGGSFCGEWKFTFLIFIPKPSFRKITLCCLFLATLSPVRSCELYLSFTWHSWAFQGIFPDLLVFRSLWSQCWDCTVTASSTALLSQSVPTSFLSRRTKALHLSHQPPCTAVHLTFQFVTEALAAPRAHVEPSLAGVTEVAGLAVGWRVLGGTKKVAAFRRPRLLECLTR